MVPLRSVSGRYRIALGTFLTLLATMITGATLAGVADAGAIIDNGSLVQLGINTTGNLDVPGGTASAPIGSTTGVGLRYIPTNGESLAPGCLCEGWGVANADDTTGKFASFADVNESPFSFDAGNNLTVQSAGVYGGPTGETTFRTESAGTRFRSTVTAPADSPRVRVTHDFHPSSSANLYEIVVTSENIGTTAIGDLRYRRVRDWDIPPITFSE